MLTAKGKYGLKAIAHLARLAPGETAPVAVIAVENNIPRKFLDSILLDLRKAGLLRSRKGPGGGYGLAMAAEAIKLGDVVRALDGPLAPIACASRTAFQPCQDCPDVAACDVRRLMSRVRDAIAAILDGMSAAELAAPNFLENL